MSYGEIATGIGVAAALYGSHRYAWWRPPVTWQTPRVLMYHMISEHRPRTRFNKLRVPPKAFRQQVAWLGKKGFSFGFASELFGNKPPSGKIVCLTFDDGYRDNLLEADKVLAEFDGKATLYLVEERDGGWSSKKKNHHGDDELGSEPKLSDDEVRDLLTTGRWELGGHTRTHANLNQLSPEEAKEEIVSAKETFREKFSCEAPTFAYPFGIFNNEHVTLVREAGYLGAMTTDAGISPLPLQDPYRICRIKVSGKEGMLGFLMRMRSGKRGLTK